MNFTVINKDLQVGAIKVGGVAASSVFLIGDTQEINLSAAFDTPPESIGPIVFLPSAAGREGGGR